MPQFKTGTPLGLINVKTNIEDKSYLSSDYFILSDFDQNFGVGKNSLIINNPPADLRFEATDLKGIPLYSEVASNVDIVNKTKTIIISFQLYSQNSMGIGKLILLGKFNKDTI